jgi:hypothetical protein
MVSKTRIQRFTRIALSIRFLLSRSVADVATYIPSYWIRKWPSLSFLPLPSTGFLRQHHSTLTGSSSYGAGHEHLRRGALQLQYQRLTSHTITT